MNRVVVATCLAVMLGLASHPAAQSPAGPTDVRMIELAVKDSKRVPESWAYYAFGGPMMGGYRSTAAPQPKASCFNCHSEHAARDNVFMQFYGLLNDAATKK
jgi:Cytochrome P460